MLYMQTNDGGLKIIVLESANLEEIKKGRPAKTPDNTVLITWTPDPEWLAEQIANSDGNAVDIARAIDESQKRPQQPVRPSEPTRFIRVQG